jgi:serine/threonine protein kinase
MYRIGSAEPLFSLSDTKIAERIKATFPWVTTDSLFCHQLYGIGEWQIQGWKLHLSATVSSALPLLDVVLPVLNHFGVRFKLISSLPNLLDLNNGLYGLTQVGKFLTIYPSSIEETINLLSELIGVLSPTNLCGPKIATDRLIAGSRICYYRYGAFRQPTSNKSSEMMFFDTAGRLSPDFRLPYYSQPEFAGDDPFLKTGLSQSDDSVVSLYLNRFLIIKALHRSIWGCVLDAIDLGAKPPQRCVIKEYWPFVATDIYGRDSTDHALLEASILENLNSDGVSPNIYEVLSRNDTNYLVMEKLQGQTLNEKFKLNFRSRPEVDPTSLIRLGKSIAKAIVSLNKKDIVHRDIKPSNIMIDRDDHVKLVDLAFAYRLGFDVGPPIGLGTLGFCPQDDAELLSPSFVTDVFGWGAVMHLIATGQEPTTVSGSRRLPAIKQPTRQFRKDLPRSLANLIDRSVSENPNERPESAEDVLVELTRIKTHRIRPSQRIQEVGKSYVNSTDWGGLATKAAIRLCDEAVAVGQGLTWQSALEGSGESSQLSNIYSGAAGIALALAQIGAVNDIAILTHTAEKAAIWLGSEELAHGSSIIGLYSGEAGIGYFFCKLAELTGNFSYVNMAIMRAHRMKGVSTECLDLVDGVAGLVIFFLRLFEVTGNVQFRDTAVKHGDLLLGKAIQLGRGLYWEVPSIIPGASRSAFLGLLHGAAGIGLSLLSLGHLTGETRFTDAAYKTGLMLLDTAYKNNFDNALGYMWPHMLDDRDVGFSAHCHGSGGIGQFFIRLWQVFRESEFLDAAIGSSLSILNRDPKHSSLCHGLAGDGSLFLDLFQATGEKQFIEFAQSLARRLGIYSFENGLWKRTFADTDSNPDYMTGSAGISAFLLRLSKPDTLPDLMLPSFEKRLKELA